jgi:predicted hydrocarbon binding protein
MSELHSFRERLTWDLETGEVRDGEVRYLLIRPDTLMGMFALLPPAARAEALEAFRRSTAEHGRKSAARYQTMGADDAERLIATIEATAPQIGWGRWRIAREADALTLEVANSPFVAGSGPSEAPVCAPISGMFAAVSNLIAGAELRAEETACAAAGASHCRFRAAL